MKKQRAVKIGFPLLASQLVEFFGGELVGGKKAIKIKIESVANLQEATATQLTFCERNYLAAQKSQAGIIVVNQKLASKFQRPIITTEGLARVYIAQVLETCGQQAKHQAGIHPTAIVDQSAKIAKTASIGPRAIIEAGAKVAVGAVVGANAFLGENCTLGANSVLFPGVIIGAEGFGFVKIGKHHRRFHHQGKVVIGKHVEVGANSCIDRGALSNTVIGDYTKIDNLVQIGHNVQIGKDCLICANVGIAGSVEISDGCIIGGAAGVADHVTIAKNVQVMGGTLVFSNVVEPGAIMGGMLPARSHQQYLRLIRKLGKLGRENDRAKSNS